MKIIKDYPKYIIRLHPYDLDEFENPIGECELIEKAITIDFDKVGYEKRLSDNEICNFIANTLGLSHSYVRSEFYPELMTWGRLKSFVDKVAPDYAEISSIEIHNYGDSNVNMSVNVERAGDGSIIIDQDC